MTSKPHNGDAEARAREILDVARTASDKLLEKARADAERLLSSSSSPYDLRLFAQDMAYVKSDVAEIKAALANKYVTQEAFEPVRRVVYGLVTVVMLSVVGAIMALVMTK